MVFFTSLLKRKIVKNCFQLEILCWGSQDLIWKKMLPIQMNINPNFPKIPSDSCGQICFSWGFDSFLFHLPSFPTSSFWFQEATTAARPHRQEALEFFDGCMDLVWQICKNKTGVTLSPIIMEVEDGLFEDSTHLPGPCFPLPWLWEEG